jgi:hypothetical protein
MSKRHQNQIASQKHSPTAMVGLCFALLLLYKHQYRIHMPRQLMDDLDGEVSMQRTDDKGEVDEGVA